LKHDRVERTLCLPGELERKRRLPAARLAVEQRAAYFLLERDIKQLKGLGTADEIVRWRREKDARRELLVFRAVGKKDFHTVADPQDQIIATHRDKGKTAGSKKAAR